MTQQFSLLLCLATSTPVNGIFLLLLSREDDAIFSLLLSLSLSPFTLQPKLSRLLFFSPDRSDQTRPKTNQMLVSFVAPVAQCVVTQLDPIGTVIMKQKIYPRIRPNGVSEMEGK